MSPFHGVRSSQPCEDVPDLARAYAVRMPAHQHFSHLTAAAILGLRMPQSSRIRELHVTSLGHDRAPRVHGVVGHRSARITVPIVVAGLRVTDAVQTWCDLGAFLALDDLVIMGDGLVRRKRPLAALRQLTEAVAGCAGRRGHRRLVEALALVRAGTDSARETMLRLIVLRAEFPEPEVNPLIRNRYGAEIAHGDLTYPQYRTVLEYDGGQHREDEKQFNIDIDRLDELMEENWRVIRVNKNLMARRATLVDKVRTALIAGGWRPGT